MVQEQTQAPEPESTETTGDVESGEVRTPESFLNLDRPVVGRTVSTKGEPNTSTKFHFWLSAGSGPQANLEIGNIVAAFADDREDITFGTVIEMRSYSDVDSFIADYLSHDFGQADIELPTDTAQVIVVTCAVMRHLSGRTRPVGRSRVYWPSVRGIEFAYGIIDESGQNSFSGTPVPIGVFENGDGTVAPIRVDDDFVLGPLAAHVNVTGISGLAAKTSAVTFALKSLLTHSAKRVAVVAFNVKHRDLLYMDVVNPSLDEEPWSQHVYRALGIPEEPFTQVRYYAPVDPRNPQATQSLRQTGVTSFSWDLQMIYEDIPTLFNPDDWDERAEGVWFVIADEIRRNPSWTYAQMTQWVTNQIRSAQNTNQNVMRGYFLSTWQKVNSHLTRFPFTYSGLLRTVAGASDIPFQSMQTRDVFVVDIQMLNDRGQRLVFSRAMRTISDMLETASGNVDAVVVFVDELNKFAPAGNFRSPIKEQLIEITARGRSIGLVLFGAEQFSSSVDRQVVDNSATFMFGRTETNELRTPAYTGFTDEVKSKITTLPQGQLLLKFAKFSQPIFIRFPFPPCLGGDQAGGE